MSNLKIRNNMPWTGIASTGVDFLSNAFGLFGQKSEASKNRDWQEEMMNKQNEWNLAQWYRESAYNSPKQQMERLKEAGLNPDMVYGQGQIENVGAVGPRSSQSMSPVMPDYSKYAQGMGSAIKQGLEALNLRKDIETKDADIALKESQTEKTDKETSILSSQAKFADALYAGDVALKNVNVRLADSNIKLNDSQIAKLYQETKNAEQMLENLKADYQLKLSQVSNLDAQTQRQLIENAWANMRESAEVRNLMAHADLTEKQASLTIQLMGAQIFNLNKQSYLNHELAKESIDKQDQIRALVGQINATTEGIKINNELNARYGDVERIVGLAGAVPSVVAKLVGGFTIK